MIEKHVRDEPSQAEAEQEAVHVRGPEGVDVMLTPKAALETAHNLEQAAMDAIINDVTTSAKDGSRQV